MSKSSVAQSTSFEMNTEITYRVFGENAQEALNSGKAEMIRLENTLSRFIPESEIGEVNRSAYGVSGGIGADQRYHRRR